MAIDYAMYVRDLVQRAKAAQEVANNFTQEKVDELCAAIAYNTTQPDFARELAQMLVDESGMGDVENKIAKIYTKVKGGYRDMKGQPSVGLIHEDEEKGVKTYAKPMGVIGAIIPVTNGEATPIFKAISAIKGRNSIILAPHPKASRTNMFATNKIRQILKKYGAPEDLVIAIEPEYVSVECSGELMKQVDFVLATGGTPMVKAAYSSGTPTIGVGTGNVVTIVDGTTDLDKTADLIIASKKFDHATSCSTENNIIVFEDCYEDFVDAMAKKGAYLIREDSPDKEKIVKTLWPNTPVDNVLNREIIAQPATKIAKLAGVEVPEDTVLIMVEENGGFGVKFPLTGEKLSPVSGVRKAKDFDDAVEKLEKTLEYQGLGHSCGIHTTIQERVDAMANRLKVTKIVNNMAQSLVNSGAWTCGYPMSMTLGCGTWGNNSVSHNVTWKDLLNFTYVARPIPSTQPTDEELFDGKTY
ncbi:MAG: aldehyde dehydrogenase family protein [Clostridiales bacterium]|jgi:sulfoacetaldehyde dehydrogenase|nr:aldehyde dehydrogenase family protein [Clostridiales bacterium]